MTAKDRFLRQLKRARDTSLKILACLKTPQEWTHQVHPKANHPLWFAGHIAWTDNFMLQLLAPEKMVDRPDFAEKFGMGSKPTGDPADYPDAEEVLAYMRDRRAALLSVLEGLSDADLAQPTRKPSDFLPDVASVFELAIWHEGLHTGQLTVAHRSLGYAPLVGG